MLKPYSRADLFFRLEESIGGEGRNSEVYTAHDPQLDAQIVIKKIPKTEFSNEDDFFQESSVLYMSGHPYVVPIHYACEDEDFIYLAMPFYSKGSLNKLINERFLTVREIVRYATQLLSALHNIHSKKLIHFDIKPDNILISTQNEALVSDFGLTKPVGQNGLAEQDRAYFKVRPPECYNTEEHSLTYDIYQAGLVLYRMCMGNKEFYRQFDQYGEVANFDHDRFRFDLRNGRFPSRSDFLEHIPQSLITLIIKALKPAPNERYASAIDMINALADIDDKLLDWKYSTNAAGERNWTKDSDSRRISLNIDNENVSNAYKTTNSGNRQRIRAYCLDSINRATVKAFLRGH